MGQLGQDDVIQQERQGLHWCPRFPCCCWYWLRQRVDTCSVRCKCSVQVFVFRWRHDVGRRHRIQYVTPLLLWLIVSCVDFAANNRFDKAVKSAIVSSAAKLGGPASVSSSSAVHPSKTSSAAQHATGSASSHPPSASASKVQPSPAESSNTQAIAVHPTGDAVASFDEQRHEKTASAVGANPTPEKEPRAVRANSRFFRL